MYFPLCTDWLSAAIDWVVDKVLSVLGLDELVNRLINAILEPLKLGVLGELGDVFNGLVNLNAAQFLQDRAIAALRDVQDDIPLDAVKTVRAYTHTTCQLSATLLLSS